MKKKKAKRLSLDDLRNLIARYNEAAIAESWKGGGDPEDIRTLELELELARVRLESLIAKLEREFGFVT